MTRPLEPLDIRHAGDIADWLVAELESEGFDPEESIPGLCQAILDMAKKVPSHGDTYITLAIELLEDGADEGRP